VAAGLDGLLAGPRRREDRYSLTQAGVVVEVADYLVVAPGRTRVAAI
jgi:hypothetical protein